MMNNINHINDFVKRWGCMALAVLSVAGCTSPAKGVAQPPKEVTPPCNFTQPVRFPLLLSSNYGELRGTHLHAGLDIKTQGGINRPVLAVESGTVVRILVSQAGFGKALYLRHADGSMSVYGHLERFAEPIEAYVRGSQYERYTFALDVEPPAGRFTFKRGEQCALSGNRGASGGPHLHLEVRDANNRPYNLLARNMFAVRDTIPPRPLTLYYVAVDTVEGIPTHSVRGKWHLVRSAMGVYLPSDTGALRVASHGYFALEVEEKKNGTDNHMGIYATEVAYDGRPALAFCIDLVGFDVGRASYAAALYPEARMTRNGVYRLFRLPNNRLPIYDPKLTDGMLNLTDRSEHDVTIALHDDCGNSAQVAFPVVWALASHAVAGIGEKVLWNRDFDYSQEGLTLTVPAGTLFESMFLRVRCAQRTSRTVAPVYTVGSYNVPIYGSFKVAIAVPELPAALRSKALVVGVGAKGSMVSAGGAWSDGKVVTECRNFGSYSVAVDTVAPRVSFRFADGADLSSRRSMSAVMSDNLSGVVSYTAMIDGAWALFEFDAKTATLTHFFDDTRWPKGGSHTLVLTATDAKGNSRSFSIRYKR